MLRFVASIVITGLILVALTQRFDAIPDSLAIAAWGVPVYAGVLVVYGLLRSVRWWFLLRPLQPDAPIPLTTAIYAGLAGTMWIALLPWRLGEFARPLLVAKRSRVTASQALGVVAIERVCDGLVICGLFLATAATLPARPELAELAAGTIGFAAVFLTAFVGLIAAALWPQLILRLIRATVGRVMPGLSNRLCEVAEGLCEGLRALPSARPLAPFLACTLLYWAVNAFGMWLLASACGLSISLIEITSVMTVVNLVLIIPGPPAQLGTFHAGILFGLAMFLSPQQMQGSAAQYAFYLYVMQLLSIIGLGLWAHRKLGIRITELRASTAHSGPDDVVERDERGPE